MHGQRKFADNNSLKLILQTKLFMLQECINWNHSMNIFEITVKTAGLLIGKRANRQSES